MDSSHKYPSKEEIAADVANETTAINVAITAMHEALDGCPLPSHVKIYAVCELLFKLSDAERNGVGYLEDVFDEIRVLRQWKGVLE